MTRVVLVLGLLTTVAATTPSSSGPAKGRFRTGDAIVVGTIKNLDYQIANIPDDLLGHGWITARLHVVRVERGRVPSRDLKVKYFAHTYLYEGRVTRVHIRPNGKDIYLICSDGGEGAACK